MENGGDTHACILSNFKKNTYQSNITDYRTEYIIFYISIIKNSKRYTVIIFTIIIDGKAYYNLYSHKFQPLVLKNVKNTFLKFDNL